MKSEEVVLAGEKTHHDFGRLKTNEGQSPGKLLIEGGTSAEHTVSERAYRSPATGRKKVFIKNSRSH